jgi:putative ABC transport system permease protein
LNVFKISWLLFKNNLKLYRFYLGVLILATAIYYNFLAVNYNPYLKVLGEQYVFAQFYHIKKLCLQEILY